ncbi:serine hydrolase domain-containing protein [Pseudomonas sp. GM48]|uniref:serine hydrolase domain-containing protein n=1 Tax=Pseudomonas sp. GM48 TaxID=1144330 RepID=UPI0002702003|nr:serine hydrolase domain-containing protein [Pseudomonas sp. GM48]EJM62085.1 penicillin-binding protein, beta-lactamase class C [Pseudomonas sp. GM48]
MPNSSLTQRLDTVIQHAIDQRSIVGAVVLVSQNGQLIYHNASGQADREAGTPMQEDTIFRFASVTKPIVSATVMRLVEEGHLELDAPISRYLPNFRPRLADGSEPDITIHHLLTHTAGLNYRFFMNENSDYHRLNVSDGMDQPGLSIEENLRRIADAPLLFSPGAQWNYSLATDVLGAVIERVEGRRLGEVVREYVTGPLKMEDTGFHVSDLTRLAKPYADGTPAPVVMSEGMQVPLDLPGVEGAVRFSPSRILNPASYHSGGAGMAGTAGDVLRFLEAIRTDGAGLLTPQTIQKMMQDHVGSEVQTQGPGWGFGYGWAVLSDASQSDTPHNQGTLQWGGVYGHYWFVDPVSKLTVVSLTNTSFEGMSGAFPFAVRDAVYGHSVDKPA